MLFGKRRFRSLVSFRSLLELGFGAFLVLLWPFWGPLAALLHAMVHSKALVFYNGICRCLVFRGGLVAFGVCVLRGVVDFSCPGGQVEAFRGVSEAFGGHFGGQKPSNTIEKPMVF